MGAGGGGGRGARGRGAWCAEGAAAAVAALLAAGARAGNDYHKKPIPLEENGGLLEFSVIYSDRAVNSMSSTFQTVMKDLDRELTGLYQAERAVIIPGSGTYGMEAVARQLASGKKTLVLRNGLFSYRWTDIFTTGDIPEASKVLKAQPSGGDQPQYSPRDLAEVQAEIAREKPAVVFAPHVETSLGLLLPDDYVKGVAEATRAAGGLFVLDGIASGLQWVNMKALGVDVYLTAPQKGWSSPACAGIVMLGPRANKAVSETTSDTYSLNLRKWRDVMEAYLGGGFAYHTTMPTDCLQIFRDAVLETRKYGFKKAHQDFVALGKATREMLERKGFRSVSAPGFQAPGVVVSYTDDAALVKKVKAQGVQLAAGVPWMLDEKEGLVTFRVGLFGLDKIKDVEWTVWTLESALDNALPKAESAQDEGDDEDVEF